jgi:RNA polymerase sigma-70 factor (ECF subfamily)
MESREGVPGPGDALAESLALAQRARDGDREALERLLARYQDRLRRIVRILLGPRLREVEESMDIVQETYLVAFQQIRTFEPTSHGAILGWLTAIARHRIGDASRRETAQKRDRGREARSAGGMEESDPLQTLGHDSTPSRRLSRTELAQIYDECVAALPERHRDAIVWRDHGLHSFEELRARLELPSVKAARSLYERASHELKEALERRLGSAWLE